MSYFGYADFDHPLDFDSGRIFHPFGGGAFILLPHRCALADLDDPRPGFSLDLIRSGSPSGGGASAILEMRLDAVYATAEALSFLRARHPRAVVAPCALSGWEFRLASGPATVDLPRELFRPSALAANNLGSARMVLPLSIEGGLILEKLLKEGEAPVHAVAEAQVKGISPRVEAVVRFKAGELLGILSERVDEDGLIAWQALVNFFNRDLNGLPIQVSGRIEGDRQYRFGEAMADRLVARFGSFAAAKDESLEPLVRFEEIEPSIETDIFWSLSQPFLASRRLILHFDLLSEVRLRIREEGTDAFVRRHTAAQLPSLGRHIVTVFCHLPAERVGIAALGVTLISPPSFPHRPQGKSLTVLFEPPEDLVSASIQLSPGEALEFEYSTFAVVSDEQGVRELRGARKAHAGSLLRLSPDDFPVTFLLVEASRELAALARLEGECRYELEGREYAIPFGLDSGRLAVSLALPRDSEAVQVRCRAVSRENEAAVLEAGPFESGNVRLDLSSFPGYGSHQLEFECEFDGAASVYAVDVLPAGVEETFESITILAFTPKQSRRSYRWFARSPFEPGIRYRRHRDDDSRGGWRDVRSPGERLVIKPEVSSAGEEIAAVALSETATQAPVRVRAQPMSESEAVSGEGAARAPISPESEPTDLLLYDDPEDPTRKFYIPRYLLATQTVSGRQRYRIAMTQQDATSTLTVHLVKAPAEALREAARDAHELPHEIAVTLAFLQAPPAGARKTLTFQEVTVNGDLVTAAITFATLEERDEVFRALTESERQARLLVKRVIEVAVPQPPSSGDDRPYVGFLRAHAIRPVLMATTRLQPRRSEASLLAARLQPARLALTGRPVIAMTAAGILNVSLPTPVLSFTGSERKVTRGRSFVRMNLSVTNWNQFSNDFFRPSPDLPPCGKNRKAARTWVDIIDGDTNARLYGFCALSSPKNLAELGFSVPDGERLPRRVYVRLTDRRSRVIRKSNVVETQDPEPAEPVYREVERELDHAVQPAPFAFPPSLHPYMFGGIVAGTSDRGLIRFRVAHESRFHTYLQDATRPERVYYFPDQFKISRRQEAPFSPFITVRVVSHEGREDTEVVFDYIVAPYSRPDRLREARIALIADPEFGASRVDFQPFATSDVRFFVDRPTARGSIKEERSGASLLLQGSLKDTLVMNLADFGVLFDAMHRDTASLFLGRVEIDVPEESTEVIPFTARFEDLAGELFLYSAAARGNESFEVSLLNAIESPVRINALKSAVIREGERVEASIRDLALPVEELAPGSTVTMTVAPVAPLPGSGPAAVEFDLAAVAVLPDPDAIWEAILDRSTLEYFDTITVKAIPGLFDPVAGRENEQIVTVLVEFESGGTAELNASQPESEVRIDYPIDDVILRQGVDTTHHYRVRVFRKNGNEESDAEPRECSGSILFVSVKK